ncbi:MAG TPA: hypothetical protein VJB87_00105 [Candidatus Nanoarchaeia archaeon]|nr:hypothetical protein [Candidatus Nanoarchaeia archaeon]
MTLGRPKELEKHARRLALRAEGLSVREIAEQEDVTTEAVRYSLRIYNTPSVQTAAKTQTEKTARRLSLWAEGLSVRKIAKREGVTPHAVYGCIRRYGSEEIRAAREVQLAKRKSELVDRLRRDFEVLPYTELGEKYGRCSSTLRGLLGYEGRKPYIHSADFFAERAVTFWDRDTHILDGWSLREIATAEDVYWQAIDAYLRNHGLKDLWKEAKVERRRREEESKQGVVNATAVLAASHREHASLAEQYAIQYMERCRWYPSIDREKILAFFEIYVLLREQGGKMSVKKIAEEVGLSAINVNRILDRLDLPTVGYRRNHVASRVETRERDQRIVQAYGSKVLSVGAIAYFEKMTYANVTRIIYKSHQSAGRIEWHVEQSVASQVFEALDVGFVRGDLGNLLDVSAGEVDFAIAHRDELASRLVDGLRVLKQNPLIDKPYL